LRLARRPEPLPLAARVAEPAALGVDLEAGRPPSGLPPPLGGRAPRQASPTGQAEVVTLAKASRLRGMARISLDTANRGLLARLAAWYSRRRLGKVVEPLVAWSRHPGVLLVVSRLEMGVQRRWRRLDATLQALAVMETLGSSAALGASTTATGSSIVAAGSRGSWRRFRAGAKATPSPTSSEWFWSTPRR
jgi:hypothetical protein